MGADEQDGPAAEAELQFEHAEFGEEKAGIGCAVCKQPIAGTYFQAGPATLCPGCRLALEQAQNRKPGLGGFLRACVYGALAAVAGSLLYFGISALTGYNFGLIAIVVGVFVGQAVRKGSGGRGGLLYQLLAVFLTYSSIVTTYIPYIVHDLAEQEKREDTAAAAAQVPAPGASKAAASRPEATQKELSPAGKAAGFSLALVFLFCMAFAVPFLSLGEGGHGVMGLIIIAIGLMEAWKANRWVQVTFSGPFEIRPVAPVAPSAGS